MVEENYTLEFRTWNGSAYVWTDYTDRLVSFGEIGAEVEQSAYPNAFRIQLSDIILRNDDGFWDDIEVLDGLLHKATEPYGQSIYKRLYRLSVVRPTGTYPIAVGQVRDILLNTVDQQAIMQVTSLDARAADQNCDDLEAERHPLGSTDAASPSNWTKTQPASATGEVAMYRWREEDEAAQDVQLGYHHDKHYADVIERTAWALDDLDTDIVKTFRLMTSPDREIVTTRDVPPNDDTVSSGGLSPERTRAQVWNPERNVTVLCIGHFVYDLDPVTDIKTLRNTLTSGRDIQLAFYLDKADSGGKDKRLVLVQCDVATYANDANRVATAWVTVLDATGSGAYTVLANESSLGTDVFPGTHMMREGTVPGAEHSESWIGSWASPNPAIGLENSFVPFRQEVNVCDGGGGSEVLEHEGNITSLFDTDTGDAALDKAPPVIMDRGWAKYYSNKNTTSRIGLKFSIGCWFAAAVNWFNTGGELYYFTWDTTNGYRLKSYNLNTYAAGSYTALDGANTHVPYVITCHKDDDVDELVLVAQLEWDNTGTTPQYSTCHFKNRNLNTASWSSYTFLSGATGSNQAWMIQEMALLQLTASTFDMCAILWNRETLKYRFVKEIATSSWTDTNTNSQTGFINGVADQDDRLEGLCEHPNYSTKRMFFIQAGPNFLWSWNQTTLTHENGGRPINQDRGVGSRPCVTEANYPDSNTPNGMMFWISANDYRDLGTEHPPGRYVLCQFANFDPGFIDLVDISGLSFWKLRSEIATAKGFVHFYAPDGTLVFKPRETSGAASFVFSKANKNYISARLRSRGYEAIANVVIVQPWSVVTEERVSTIVKALHEMTENGELVGIAISGAPGESATWQLRFVSKTTFDLYKLTGAGSSTSAAQLSAVSIDALTRDIPNGEYLQFFPEHFEGAFVVNDNFTFTVFDPQESLQQTDFYDRSRVEDTTSKNKYRRRIYTLADNRFLRRQVAGDHANNLLTWRKVRHEVVDLQVASDPAYQPLMRCTLADTENGLDGTYQIMGIRYRPRKESTLMIVKV